MAELLREAAAACAAEAIAESRVGGKLRESSGHGFHVARWDEKACLARDADFSRAIDVVAHDRLAGDECLRERAGESFAKACVDEQVHRSEQLGNSRRWNEPRELKMFVHSGGVDLLLELLAKNAVADEEKTDLRLLPDHLFGS